MIDHTDHEEWYDEDCYRCKENAVVRSRYAHVRKLQMRAKTAALHGIGMVDDRIIDLTPDEVLSCCREYFAADQQLEPLRWENADRLKEMLAGESDDA